MRWYVIPVALLMIAQAEQLPSTYQEIFKNDWQREGHIQDGRIYDNQYRGGAI